MLILGVDTSGKNGSIALVRCEEALNRKGREDRPRSSHSQVCQTLEVVSLEGGTFSAQLVPQIATLLQKHGLAKHQIDAFGVVSGPGSFTGLRVGLAAIKALAEILGKPIVAVSLLEAVVVATGLEGRVLAALDAGRGEIYVGSYDVMGCRAECASEEVVTQAEFSPKAQGQQVAVVDAKLAGSLLEPGLNVHKISRPGADAIASLGFQKLQAGESVSPLDLEATYIRRSEAEMKLGRLP
jgi:tRNA threonylcarbamoyladenosine biosynthesis protein TsaB